MCRVLNSQMTSQHVTLYESSRNQHWADSSLCDCLPSC